MAPVAPLPREGLIVIQINDKCMSLTLGGEIFATARFSQYAAADDNGAWIVCTHPRPAVLPQPGDHGSDARRTPRRWLWPEPWPGRCPSHRLAGPGPSRQLRTPHAAHRDSPASKFRPRYAEPLGHRRRILTSHPPRRRCRHWNTPSEPGTPKAAANDR